MLDALGNRFGACGGLRATDRGLRFFEVTSEHNDIEAGAGENRARRGAHRTIGAEDGDFHFVGHENLRSVNKGDLQQAI